MPETQDNKTNGTKEQPKQQRALVPVKLNGLGMLQPANLTEAIEVAKIIAHSGIIPKHFEGNPGAVLVAIQMGCEVGLSPMAALQGIAVINGRPAMYGDALLALVVSHCDCEDVVEDFDQKTMTATCTVKRRDRALVVRTFSQEDAKTAGLWGKQGPWTQYPKRMLQMRARGFALRDAFPDALRGINVAEEARDIVETVPEWVNSETGEIREGVHKIRGNHRQAPPVEPQPIDAELVAEKAPEPAPAPAPPPAEPPRDAENKPTTARSVEREKHEKAWRDKQAAKAPATDPDKQSGLGW